MSDYKNSVSIVTNKHISTTLTPFHILKEAIYFSAKMLVKYSNIYLCWCLIQTHRIDFSLVAGLLALAKEIIEQDHGKCLISSWE